MIMKTCEYVLYRGPQIRPGSQTNQLGPKTANLETLLQQLGMQKSKIRFLCILLNGSERCGSNSLNVKSE